ncbi:MAG: hypothetical protein POH28_12930, partial [Acidocella sp.]|nr:hypothetical protein [Acidocella sp.]
GGHDIAIFPQSPSKLVDDCIAAWAAHGGNVHNRHCPAIDPMLIHDLDSEGQVYDFQPILGWVKGHVTPHLCPTPIAPRPRTSLHLPNATESSVHFGPGDRLFAILSTPHTATHDTAILILNAGRDPHYGVANFSTVFARNLAAAGIASMRMDFAGLGDSLGTIGAENKLSHVLETDRNADITAAIDLLKQRGYGKIILQGNCGGAFHAFHAALTDTRIESLLLVNFPIFLWSKDTSIVLTKRNTFSLRYYTKKIMEPNAWRRTFRGDISFHKIIAGQVTRMFKKFQKFKNKSASLDRFEQKTMAKFAQRGLKTLFLFHRDNGGLFVFEDSFGKDGKDVENFPGAKVQIIAEPADHLRYDQALFEGGRIMLDYVKALSA